MRPGPEGLPMIEITLSVPEIQCDHCKTSIEGALTQLEGVKAARVDIETSTVFVAYAPPVTLQDIVAAIEAEGYQVPEQG
jgi:copper chaperone